MNHFRTSALSALLAILALPLTLRETQAQTKGSYTLYGTGCKGSGVLPGGKVVPTAYATKWGESNNVYPFGWTNQRYMQVHSAADIGVIPQTVRGLAFRTKSARALTARVIPCTINIGYTNSTTNALSTTFASNWLGTPQTGFNGNLNVPSTAVNNSLTKFDTVIPFTAPFIYLSARGNLLWECQNRATSRPGLNVYDRVASQPSLTGRMWATGASAATGTFRAGEGLVMQLVGTSTTGAIVNLTNTGIPSVNRSFQVNFSGAASNTAAVLWLGAQKLNISLAPTLPGCTLYTSLDLLVGSAATGTTGNGSLTLIIPNNASLAGVKFLNQWMVLDRQANTIGVVLSNGGEATIGS